MSWSVMVLPLPAFLNESLLWRVNILLKGFMLPCFPCKEYGSIFKYLLSDGLFKNVRVVALSAIIIRICLSLNYKFFICL